MLADVMHHALSEAILGSLFLCGLLTVTSMETSSLALLPFSWLMFRENERERERDFVRNYLFRFPQWHLIVGPMKSWSFESCPSISRILNISQGVRRKSILRRLLLFTRIADEWRRIAKHVMMSMTSSSSFNFEFAPQSFIRRGIFISFQTCWFEPCSTLNIFGSLYQTKRKVRPKFDQNFTSSDLNALYKHPNIDTLWHVDLPYVVRYDGQMSFFAPQEPPEVRKRSALALGDSTSAVECWLCGNGSDAQRLRVSWWKFLKRNCHHCISLCGSWPVCNQFVMFLVYST